MNKDWINLQFQDPLFLEGIESFLNFARENLSRRQTILCPCNKCGNQRLPSTYDDVKYDLVMVSTQHIKFGTYIVKV